MLQIFQAEKNFRAPLAPKLPVLTRCELVWVGGSRGGWGGCQASQVSPTPPCAGHALVPPRPPCAAASCVHLLPRVLWGHTSHARRNNKWVGQRLCHWKHRPGMEHTPENVGR